MTRGHRAGAPRWADMCLRDQVLSYQGDIGGRSPPPILTPCQGFVVCKMTCLEYPNLIWGLQGCPRCLARGRLSGTSYVCVQYIHLQRNVWHGARLYCEEVSPKFLSTWLFFKHILKWNGFVPWIYGADPRIETI